MFTEDENRTHHLVCLALLVSRYVATLYQGKDVNILLINLNHHIAGLCFSSVGALSEDLEKSVDNAFPALAAVVANSQPVHLSKNAGCIVIKTN